jgi:hypothetical protein
MDLYNIKIQISLLRYKMPRSAHPLESKVLRERAISLAILQMTEQRELRKKAFENAVLARRPYMAARHAFTDISSDYWDAYDDMVRTEILDDQQTPEHKEAVLKWKAIQPLKDNARDEYYRLKGEFEGCMMKLLELITQQDQRYITLDLLQSMLIDAVNQVDNNHRLTNEFKDALRSTTW